MNEKTETQTPPKQNIFRSLRNYFTRYYKILIVVFLLMLNYALFNTLYVNLFLHVGKATSVGVIQSSEQAGKYAIDKHGEARFDGQETYQMVGWAFPEKMSLPLADYHKQIVLIDEHSIGYYFEPMEMTRVDVTKAFTDLGVNVDQSGWLVNISKYVLPKGKYNLAFLFSPSDGSEPILCKSDVYLTRTANTLQISQG